MNCDFLWNEYELLYNTYESFNEQSLTLKSWSVTVGLAAIIAVYAEKVTLSGRVAILIAAFSAIPFWITDAFWKSYQNGYVARLQALELIKDCTNIPDYKLGIVTDWQLSYDWFDWLSVLYWPSVALPHVFVLLAGLYLAWKHPPAAAGGQKQIP